MVIAIFAFPSDIAREKTLQSSLAALVLCLFLSISLLGRWTYDLAATQLTQVLIPLSHRSAFGGTEMSVVSALSLGHWIAAAVWHFQEDFKWLAVGSLTLIGIAAGVYYRWSQYTTYNRIQSEILT